MTSKNIAIGIDLGTTNSCVAVLKDGIPEVISNEYGHRTTPSVVTLHEDGRRVVGWDAKNLQYRNVKNTIYESKRLIGRKFSEECIQDRMLHWPFKVVPTEKDQPQIRVTYLTPEKKKIKKYFHPEEISGMVLEKMRNIAEEYLKCPITKAVITVPAYFNDNQRQATIDAAKIANIEVLKIINEPTAAAFAYILKNNIHEPCTTLVFDLGGGTFDVSIIQSNGNRFAVVAVNGDPDLGGADFDMLLYNEVVKHIKKKTGSKTIFNKATERRIQAQCIKVKEQLSASMIAHFELANVAEGVDFEYEFKREQFETLIGNLLKKIMATVRSTLSDAKMQIGDIDNVVLVGGSSRIPAIAKNLKDYFKKDVSFAINPDEAVACGAAFHAALLNNDASPIIRNAAIVDITPFSLGIEAEGRFMDVLIKKNTQLPASFTKMYTTVLDNQSGIRIIVFQGEDNLTANNTKLGYFDLTGIPPAPKRVPQIWVTFEINTNGVVHITASETSSNESVKIEIKTNTGRLSEADFARIEEEHRENLRKQKVMKQVASDKDGLLKFCYESKHTMANLSEAGDQEKKKYVSEVDEVIAYLENLPISNDTVLAEISRKKGDLQNSYQKLM